MKLTGSRISISLYTIAAFIALLGLADATYLTVQAFVLHAFCRYCLFSAALVFGLSAIAVLVPSSR